MAMSKKTEAKKKVLKSARKKINLLRFIFIFFAFLVAFALLFISIYGPKKNRSSAHKTTIPSKSSALFRKDGSLSFLISSNRPPVLIDIEVVVNEEDRMQGLMDRYNLPQNAGMLFIFPEEDQRSFWMKNTYISLDIIYINTNKEIVSIQKYTQPQSTYSIPSEKPAMYVLEVNAGFCDINGINPGDKVEFSYK